MPELPATAPEPVPEGRMLRARWLRRGGIGLLVLMVSAGAIGLFGIRSATVSASAAGYDMSLEYPATDRPGQPIHWALTVHRLGGFGGPVDIAITQPYLDLLDMNDIEPAPSSSITSGGFVVWTFDKPEGDLLRVTIDGSIQLDAHFGAEATVAVIEHGVPVSELHYRTWVAP
jgi:hypothetical protein